MSKHVQTVTVQPIWFTTQRVIRTAVQTTLAILVALGGSVGVLQALAPQVLAAVIDVLPHSAYVWLAGAFAFTIAVASALSKLMAIPLINTWLTKLHAGSVPRVAALNPEPTTTAGYPDDQRTREPSDALG